MLKKLVILIVIVCSIQSLKANTGSVEGGNFDIGSNFDECLYNCREYHRAVLQLPHGYGHGLCWKKCSLEYNI